jgi:hypothetical protein
MERPVHCENTSRGYGNEVTMKKYSQFFKRVGRGYRGLTELLIDQYCSAYSCCYATTST